MKDGVPDLQYRFRVGDKHYVLDVCGCDRHPAPPEYNSIVVGALYVCPPSTLLDYEDDDPDRLVRQVFDHVHPLFPTEVDARQWHEFTDRLHQWICDHRAAASIAHHED